MKEEEDKFYDQPEYNSIEIIKSKDHKSGGSKKYSKWRQEREAFIQAMRVG